jgi:hypothetical protein
MKKILILVLLFNLHLFADLKVGEKFPEISLEDQFETMQTIDKTDKWVLMVFEKDVSVGLTKQLKKMPEHYVEKKHIKIISDISTMPSFITTMFALPKMKKYPFSVMLINDDTGKTFNQEKKKVTLFALKNRKIKSITFLHPDDVGNFIGQ